MYISQSELYGLDIHDRPRKPGGKKDCLLAYNSNRSTPSISLPVCSATLKDAFTSCSSEITSISNPLSRYQTLQFLSLEHIREGQQRDPFCTNIFNTLLQCRNNKTKVPSKYSMYCLVAQNTIVARMVRTKSKVLEPRLLLSTELLVYQTALLHHLSHAASAFSAEKAKVVVVTTVAADAAATAVVDADRPVRINAAGTAFCRSCFPAVQAVARDV